MELSCYDELLQQVETLKAENCNLRKVIFITGISSLIGFYDLLAQLTFPTDLGVSKQLSPSQ